MTRSTRGHYLRAAWAEGDLKRKKAGDTLRPVKLTLTHLFEASPEEVAQTLLDPDFQDSLSDIGALAERRVLSQEAAGTGVTRRVRCVLDVEMNGIAKRLVGDGDPAWVEVAVWDPATSSWTWHIEPEMGADLLEARGTTQLLSGAGGGTERLIEADVKVKVPFYGGKVEGWIADGLRHAYDQEAERIAIWLGA